MIIQIGKPQKQKPSPRGANQSEKKFGVELNVNASAD
jgi:hypothetical protein